jgi:hypothetical protein
LSSGFKYFILFLFLFLPNLEIYKNNATSHVLTHCLPGRVLVHCEEGISRASAVAIAYLMSAGLEETKNNSEPRDGNSAASDDDDAPLKPKMSYRDAYDYVLKIRPTAAPNLAFVVALTVWERQNCPGRETASEVEALTGVLDQLSLADSHRPV